jgi:hypothetical protein
MSEVKRRRQNVKRIILMLALFAFIPATGCERIARTVPFGQENVLSQIIKAEGQYKNASYMFITKMAGLRIAFDKPVDGSLIPLPGVTVGRVTNIIAIIVAGDDEGWRLIDTSNINALVFGQDISSDVQSLAGDFTLIAVDGAKYLGKVNADGDIELQPAGTVNAAGE